MKFDHPERLRDRLREAGEALSAAHGEAGEHEGERTNLNGPTRDVIFGLNSAVDGLRQLVDEAIDDEPVAATFETAAHDVVVDP